MDWSLCQHAVVFEFRLSKRWGVSGLVMLDMRDVDEDKCTYDDDELGLSSS